MKTLWNFVNTLKLNTVHKNQVFLALSTAGSCLFGLLIWYLIHFFTLNTMPWLFCFISYPGFFIGIIGGVIYLYQHDFQ